MPSSKKKKDSIDAVVERWRAVRPDRDPWPSTIAGRIMRLAMHIRRRADPVMSELGLTWEMVDIIAALRREGPPYSMKPSALQREMLVTAGAVTNRLDRAEQAGLVQREADLNDRRSFSVTLTPRGLALADQAMDGYFSMISDTVGQMPLKDRERCAQLLADMLLIFEAEPEA